MEKIANIKRGTEIVMFQPCVRNSEEGLGDDIFVYLGLKSSAAESMYQRMAEVIQANLRGLTNDTSYSMKNARVYFKLEAQLRVKPLMIALPYFGEYDNNLDTKTDWCTYNISTTRGY